MLAEGLTADLRRGRRRIVVQGRLGHFKCTRRSLAFGLPEVPCSVVA